MQVWNDVSDIVKSEKHIVTLGTFDGIHSGHNAMIKHVVDSAHMENSLSLAITLHPHPRIVLGKADGLELITSLSERIWLFEQSGIDILYIMHFTKELADTPPDIFVSDILYDKIGMQKLIVGYDHAFGKNREGDFETLKSISQNKEFDLERFRAESVDGEIISSTKIRNAISSGEIEVANKMLGYRYFINGKVVRGDERGRKIGFPTANIKPDEIRKVVPGNGVYVVTLDVDSNKYLGVCNVGVRPTFKVGGERTIEVHLPNTDLDLYNRTVKLDFFTKVRGEKKFQNIDEIIEQIKKDIISTKKYFKDLDFAKECINFADYID